MEWAEVKKLCVFLCLNIWLTAQRPTSAAIISETVSCPSPWGATYHKVPWMWEVIENSTRGALATCTAVVFVQGKYANIIHRVWETLCPPCDDSMRVCRGESPWTNCAHKQKLWTRGQGWEGVVGRRRASDWWSWRLLGGSSCKFTHWAAF